MKRIIFIACLVCMGLTMFSCASNKEVSQEQVNEAFDAVYEVYESFLLLDGAKTYTVVEGDTLSAVAKKFYGEDKGYFFPVIMLASSETILDPDLIQVGMNLTVPDLDKNLEREVSRSHMKKFFKDIADIYKTKNTEVADSVRKELLAISKSL